MEFVYADELKRSFSVRGHFYDVEIAGKVFPCRSVLEIIANAGDSEATGVPDAVVIMMNPGSSSRRVRSLMQLLPLHRSIFGE
ncbi:MAG: hypothetical protein ACKPFK_05395, partial [Dolichospermum sp.]